MSTVPPTLCNSDMRDFRRVALVLVDRDGRSYIPTIPPPQNAELSVISPYAYTNGSIKLITFEPIQDITVKHVVELVIRNQRHRYQFSPEWEGCRFWNLVSVQDVETAEYIEKGSAEKAEADLSWYWVFPVGQEKRDMTKGVFRD
ncbi:hypothetical protein VE02_08183 [Pseudogymnoascus sp. 03VT05]|nr:hypothetical protein VE02_08183 [Pseudogymnoascus sp. 03VT05]